MNDDLTILASAYLDGDVTADERAQVESSDELLLEVDRLRTVRAVLLHHAAAGSAPISMREEHLATALGAWDRLPDNERTGALRDSTPSVQTVQPPPAWRPCRPRRGARRSDAGCNHPSGSAPPLPGSSS